MSDSDKSGDLPLAGVRILDLTRVLAGPLCTMILADLGADVVKVEHPDGGDDSRGFGPFLDTGTSVYFAAVNRGKRSITLDLKSATDRDTLLALARQADVLVENFRPGTMKKLGLDAKTLKVGNPGLIYAAISGFGASGGAPQTPAYDGIIQALSGLMSVTGHDPAHPARVGVSIADILSGLYTAIGILASFRARDRSGTGTDLDMSMLDCTVASLENVIDRFSATGEVPGPLGTRHPAITPFQAFDAADKPIYVAAGNDRLWQTLCVAVGCPELCDDPRFESNETRRANHSELEPLLQNAFAARTAVQWEEILAAAGVPCAPIRDIAEVVEDPRLQEREMLHTMHDAKGGSFMTAGTPFMLDGEKPTLSEQAPELGEHTDTVLAEWLGDINTNE